MLTASMLARPVMLLYDSGCDCRLSLQCILELVQARCDCWPCCRSSDQQLTVFCQDMRSIGVLWMQTLVMRMQAITQAHLGQYTEAVTQLEPLAVQTDALAPGIVLHVLLLLLDLYLATNQLTQAAGSYSSQGLSCLSVICACSRLLCS